MDSEAVQPLRVTKINYLSPSKMPPSGGSRPLGEVNPMGIRRNSGGLRNQNESPKLSPQRESSPFDPSPGSNSKLQFWKDRECLTADRVTKDNGPISESAPSPTRRTSLEHLKKASRVTANNIFVRQDERARNTQNVDTELGEKKIVLVRKENKSPAMGSMSEAEHPQQNRLSWTQQKLQGETRIPWLSPNKMPAWTPPQFAPSPRSLPSHKKSPLQARTQADRQKTSEVDELQTPSTDDSSDDQAHASTPRPILRQPKSVSFDVAPPQINEYEMVTPDPSSIASGSREGSIEADFYEEDETEGQEHPYEDGDSFDTSLENTEKTPVVLPEDWRFMRPNAANKELADTFEDPFTKHSNTASASNPPWRSPSRNNQLLRSDSVMSNGERRPLPPLPGAISSGATFRDSADLPAKVLTPSTRPFQLAPYVTSASRESSPVPLDQKFDSPWLKSEIPPQYLPSEEQDLAIPKEIVQASSTGRKSPMSQILDKQVVHTVQEQQEFQPPVPISRDSVLRKVQSNAQSTMSLYSGEGYADEEYDYYYGDLDPDVPIPSREDSSEGDESTQTTASSAHTTTSILNTKQEQRNKSLEGVISTSVYPVEEVVELHRNARGVSPFPGLFSSTSSHDQSPTKTLNSTVSEEKAEQQPATSTQISSSTSHASRSTASHLDMPDFVSFLGKGDLDLGLGASLRLSQLPMMPGINSHGTQPELLTTPARPQTPIRTTNDAMEEYNANSPSQRSSTPDSVIRYAREQDSDEYESPAIPEPMATIKATGSKLKTRPSTTPADIRALMTARREISDEKPLPCLPGEDEESEEDDYSDSDPEADEMTSSPISVHEKHCHTRGRDSPIKLEIPLNSFSSGEGLGLGEALDRVVEAQKRGYITRENKNIIVASNRQVSDDKSTTSSMQDELNPLSDRQPKSSKTGGRKTSGNTWRAEPWNGKMRRNASRRSSTLPERRLYPGPAPPLPGHDSIMAGGLESLAEDSGERGRVFVKVVKIKELDLPLPQDERCHFVLTLDNGLHCVTTNWTELGRTAPIGQEFELVVFDDLEFQLTLQTRLQRPDSVASLDSLKTGSCSGSFKMPKVSKLSRLLASPKKRREREQREREEEEAALLRQQDQDALRAQRRPGAWDLQHQLVSEDGSFARAYVSLSNFEQQSFGRAYTLDVPCFNEWAVEDKNIISSTRSKMGGVQRRPPYRIAKLELQLLYVPKPRDATDEEMPRSISAALRQMKEAENVQEQYFEGHLSQQGGDCPYWRRRFFKMQGPMLTAYHEITRQPRATISLARATQLIDDRSSLTQLDNTPSLSSTPISPGKGRRKSAFAHDEEGYMFVEEGFRIRFANGESIDFYADSTAEKDRWMHALEAVVGKESNAGKVTWMSIVLEREEALARKGVKKNQVQETDVPLRGGSKTTVPPSPRKPVNPAFNPRQSPSKTAAVVSQTKAHKSPEKDKHASLPNPPRDRTQAVSGGAGLEQRRLGRREAVRSMMF